MTSKTIENPNAVFNITNNQCFDEHQDTIKISTEGKFYFRNGTYFLMYKEFTDLGDVSVMIKAENDMVTIKRTGSCNTRMQYIQGTKLEILYSVPFGDLVLELETDYVDFSLSQTNGGYIELKYKLNINNETYYNNMKLEVVLNK